MELVKKNILSIVCGVVAVAAIAFHFLVTTGQFAALETEAKARAEKPAAAKSLLAEARSFTAVSDATPPKLTGFPNPKAIEVNDAIAAKLHAEATQLLAKATEINKAGYDVIVPGSLPRPINDSLKYDFRRAYNAILTPGQKPQQYDPKVPLLNLADDVLKAAAPPTDQEIKDAKEKLLREQFIPKLIVVNNVAVNQKEVEAEFLRATEHFDVDFRRERAQNYKVYLEPATTTSQGALAISPQLSMVGAASAQVPSIEAMWFGQMSLWVQADVCRAIARMNERAANIPVAPVKHLVAVDIRQDQTMYVRKGAATGGGGGGGGESGGGAPAVASEGPEVRDYAQSPTGRVGNSVYDVVHFEVVAVVDAAVVKEFMRHLQFGRFINVLRAETQVVDLDEAVDAGYDYGSRPVVEVTVRCEALFLRDWTAFHNGPMPQTVRTFLGVPLVDPNPPPAAPGATPTAAAGPM